MNIKKNAISALLIFGLFGGASALKLGNGELVEIVLKIEAIGERKNATVEDALWLVKIVKSTDLAMHSVVEPDDLSGDRLVYNPPSHYAMWKLSRILANPPYTYRDKEWEDPAYMIGERKRWNEWFERNPITLHPNPEIETVPDKLSDEKRRQAENMSLYRELSNREAGLQAAGQSVYFIALEQMYVEGKDLPGDPRPLPSASILFVPGGPEPESDNKESVTSPTGKNRGNGDVEHTTSAMSSFFILATTAILSVIGLLLFLFRRVWLR